MISMNGNYCHCVIIALIGVVHPNMRETLSNNVTFKNNTYNSNLRNSNNK